MTADPLVGVSVSGETRVRRWIAIAGGVAVAITHGLDLPHGAWEGDEILFMKGVQLFDPTQHRPHPPGYPLLIGLGKMFRWLLHDPFASLLALSVVSSIVAYFALYDAFRHLLPGPDAGSEHRRAMLGAVLFSFSPAMLIYGPTALSDAPAAMFLALALTAGARLARAPGAPSGRAAALLPAAGLGLAIAGAIGCRPQLALAALPMLAVALWRGPTWRQRGVAVVAFTGGALLWFVPLVRATGGISGLGALLRKQASLVSAYDSTAPRAGAALSHAALRFLAHPWGQRWTSFPVLALALLGCVVLVRARAARALPLAALFGVEAALGLWVLHPGDAVRYAVPSLLFVAFAAAVGGDALATRLRQPAIAWSLVVLAPLGFLVYTHALRAARWSSESPPRQAMRFLQKTAPADAAVLVDKELAPHASYFLEGVDVLAADQAGWVEHCGTSSQARRALYLLGDGESSWPGAETFRWPESDAYGKLTRGHFRVASVSPIVEAQLYTTLGDVWAFEPNVLQPDWRWLGPQARLRLHLLGTTSTSFRAMLAVPHNSPLAVATVTVSVDDVAQTTIDVPRDARRNLDFSIPPGARSVDVAFHSSQSFVPAETGMGSDTRRLAVQLLGLECLPAATAEKHQ